jgi:hypothetical protein
MNGLDPSRFRIVSCQGAACTPDEGFQLGVIMSKFYPNWINLFDGDPVTIPPFPIQGAIDVPRLILESKGGWRCEIATSRISVFWVWKPESESAAPTLEEFFKQTTDVFLDYHKITGLRFGRLAALANRLAKHENPAFFLASHFCKERMWKVAPLNRPETFELHAHKKFVFDNVFQVNSWARSKSGLLSEGDAQSPIVLFEQDMNTLPEDAGTKDFFDDDLRRFFGSAPKELDLVFQLYFSQESTENNESGT